MQCLDARELMLANLDDDDERRLRGHLSECRLCAAEWQSVSAVEALLRAQSLVDPPDGFALRVVAALERETQRLPTRQQHLMQVAFIVAGVLVMASGFLSIVSGWRGVIQDPRSDPWVAAVLRAGDVTAWALAAAVSDGLIVWLLYGLLAAIMAVFWFGAIIVPRYAIRPVRPRS